MVTLSSTPFPLSDLADIHAALSRLRESDADVLRAIAIEEQTARLGSTLQELQNLSPINHEIVSVLDALQLVQRLLVTNPEEPIKAGAFEALLSPLVTRLTAAGHRLMELL